MSKFQVGDRVRVRKPADVEKFPQWVDEMDKFDGTVQVIRQVRTSDEVVRFDVDPMNWNFHFDWLEPIRSWVPEGYSVVEMAVPDAMANDIGDGNALVWKQVNVGERYLSSAYNRVRTKISRTNEFYSVIVPTTQPAEQYRDPTQNDVGKMVDVRDCEEKDWQTRELLAVIADETIDSRFVCRDVASKVYCFTWKYARIKIEEVK
jgi:hypothetical protein